MGWTKVCSFEKYSLYFAFTAVSSDHMPQSKCSGHVTVFLFKTYFVIDVIVNKYVNAKQLAETRLITYIQYLYRYVHV